MKRFIVSLLVVITSGAALNTANAWGAAVNDIQGGAIDASVAAVADLSTGTSETTSAAADAPTGTSFPPRAACSARQDPPGRDR